MISYRLKCRKNTENINPKVSSNSNGKAMISSTCSICGVKKSRFIKNQKDKEKEEKELLSILGLRTPLSEVPKLGDICFEVLLC